MEDPSIRTSAIQRMLLRLAATPFAVWALAAVLSGGMIGLGGYTFSYAQGFSYLSDDPSACANCHAMREVYDGWNKGSHKSVAGCNDCHTPHTSLVEKYAVKAINGFNHSLAFTTGDYPNTIRIKQFNRDIALQNCLACHGNLVSQISHADKKDPTDCLACHTGVGHGR
jgi:cytochrome c nitrite reductase small subunit